MPAVPLKRSHAGHKLLARIHEVQHTQSTIAKSIGYKQPWVSQSLLDDTEKTIKQLYIQQPNVLNALLRELNWTLPQMIDALGIRFDLPNTTQNNQTDYTANPQATITPAVPLNTAIKTTGPTFNYKPTPTDNYADSNTDFFLANMQRIDVRRTFNPNAKHHIYANHDQTTLIITETDVTTHEIVTYRNLTERQQNHAPHFIAGRDLKFIASLEGYHITDSGGVL